MMEADQGSSQEVTNLTVLKLRSSGDKIPKINLTIICLAGIQEPSEHPT